MAEAQPPFSGDQGLAERVDRHVAAGYSIDTRTEHVVTLVRGHRVNHTLHAILSVFTVGFWITIWALLTRFGGRRTLTLYLQPDGTIRETTGRDLSSGAGLFLTIFLVLEFLGLALVALFIVFGVSSAVDAIANTSMALPVTAQQTAPTSDGLPTITEPTQSAAATPTPQPTATSPVGFGPGTYQVGKDIQPGIYAGRAGTGTLDSCYWERLSGATGDFSDLIANSNASGQFYVEILDTDKYFNTDCTVVPLEDWPTPHEPLMKIDPGTYMIGRDISPGTYVGRAGTGTLDSCYWERLSGATGDFSDLIANSNASGQFYVEILDTDKYFNTDCVLEIDLRG